jgi:hypothetical protein
MQRSIGGATAFPPVEIGGHHDAGRESALAAEGHQSYSNIMRPIRGQEIGKWVSDKGAGLVLPALSCLPCLPCLAKTMFCMC